MGKLRGFLEFERKVPKRLPVVDRLKNYREFKTSHFGRIDYVLPSKGIRVIDSKVYWPGKREPHRDWFTAPNPASDHRPVWADLEIR